MTNRKSVMQKIDYNKIYNKNCLEGMKLIPKNKIDLIITDPPFAIDFKAKKANYNRKSSRVLEGYNEVLPENYLQFSYDWISESNRILKESGSMYIFSGWNNLKDILIAIVFTFAKIQKKENFSHFLDLRKMKKLKMGIAYIIEIRKMYGKSNVNIGPERKKLLPNYLLK